MPELPSADDGEYTIRPLAAGDAEAMAAAYLRNREHLAPWDPRRAEAFFTTEYQTRDIAARLRDVEAGLGASWVIAHGGDIVGRVNLNNVVRGVLQSAATGYWVDQDHQGRGLATACVRLACRAAAGMGLHRLEGSTLRHNTASQRVLERCGFELYGMAPQYLFIAGSWQDHNLYQLILHTHDLD